MGRIDASKLPLLTPVLVLRLLLDGRAIAELQRWQGLPVQLQQ